jgi:hypothetical protein
MRFYNNLFAQAGDLSPYDETRLPMHLGGNVFLKGAKACKHEAAPLIKPEFDPGIRLVETPNGIYLEISLDKEWSVEQSRNTITADLLGLAMIPNLPFESADGTPVHIDKDYSGSLRNLVNPFPGPFETSQGGKQRIKIWAVDQGLRV